MAYVIAEPCINTKDTACVNVCPVDCIHPKKDEANFAPVQQLYIDPDTCIDCGACVPECPFEAIFPEDEVPAAHTMKADQERIPFGGARYKAAGGEVVNLRDDIQPNYQFYKEGPGYKAKDM